MSADSSSAISIAIPTAAAAAAASASSSTSADTHQVVEIELAEHESLLDDDRKPRATTSNASTNHHPSSPQRRPLPKGRDLILAPTFSGLRKTDDEIAVMNKPMVADYYSRQNAVIKGLLDIENMVTGNKDSQENHDQDDQDNDASAVLAIRLSFFANIVLTVIKVITAVLTGSMAVIASTIDSFLDLFSGSIIFVTQRAISRVDPYKFPSGKARLEPVGIIIFAVVMGMASLQILIQSFQRIVAGVSGSTEEVDLSLLSTLLLVSVVAVKSLLYLFCTAVLKKINSSAVEALAQDHRNDVITNSIGIGCAFLAGSVKSLWWFDCLGAIVLASVILYSWVNTGREQISMMVGRAAPAEFVGQIAYLAGRCHADILRVDTVRAYHFGIRYLCEVDIVMDENTPLKQVHDVAEALEEKIESLEQVERCFVHVDYEFQHKPERPLGGGNRIHDRIKPNSD